MESCSPTVGDSTFLASTPLVSKRSESRQEAGPKNKAILCRAQKKQKENKWFLRVKRDELSREAQDSLNENHFREKKTF